MKNKKRSNKSIQQNMQPQYEVRNMDDIAILTDDELAILLNDLQNQLTVSLKNDCSTYFTEVEICYVKRELQIRKVHHQMHQEYMNADSPSTESQTFYPEGDLDNTSYVQAWLQWRGRTKFDADEDDFGVDEVN